jgi:ATP-dependent RNA helicase DeaD
LAAPDLDDYNGVLHALAGESSDRNIALAAIRLVHADRGATIDEQEIPDASERMRGGDSRRTRAQRDGRSPDKRSARPNHRQDGTVGKGARRGGAAASSGETGFVYVSVGRKSGIRPGDLVGAIANETGLAGREIGPIRITDNYSVVGVPSGSVEHVVSTMGSTTLRGKRAKVRPYST